jgi:hypothetical protein
VVCATVYFHRHPAENCFASFDRDLIQNNNTKYDVGEHNDRREHVYVLLDGGHEMNCVKAGQYHANDDCVVIEGNRRNKE